jgi:hypothetical protein
MIALPAALTTEWAELVQTIPADLEASAQEQGALRRRRGVKSAIDLLRLILIYATVLSLRTTAVWGVGLKLCDISRQALGKRVVNSIPWLRHLLAVLLTTLVSVPRTEGGLIRRVMLRDASVISRPGSPGTEWRLHVNWCPFSLQPAQVTVTDVHTGEGLTAAELQAGDLVVADRAYGVWSAIQAVLQALAYFIIRLTWSNLPLCTPDGQSFDLIAWLQALPADQPRAEITVCAAADPQRRPLRLVVGRLPPDKAAAAREKVKRQAQRKKRTVHPNTLVAAGYCLLLTNLPAAYWPLALILACYRVRWQVEWCFRRWKSLCHLDELPAYPAPIAEAVLLAKVILILLLQRQLGALPWAEWWLDDAPAPVVSTVVQMAYTHLCEVIRPSAVIIQLLRDPTPFLRHLRSSRRQRPLQLAAAARRFTVLLPGLAPALGP